MGDERQPKIKPELAACIRAVARACRERDYATAVRATGCLLEHVAFTMYEQTDHNAKLLEDAKDIAKAMLEVVEDKSAAKVVRASYTADYK